MLFVIGTLETGGAERQMINLAAALNQRGHETSIAVLDGSGSLEGLAEEKGVPLHRLYRARRAKRGPWALVQLVRQIRPDMVHPYLPKDNVRVTLVKPWLKRGRLVWGVRASDLDLSRYPLRSRVLWPAARRLSHWADLIIANSWAGAEYHTRAGYPADRMHVAPNGIDTDLFRPDVEAGHQFRKSLGISLDTPVVGLLGRFDPMKGHDDFLKILARVRSGNPNCVGLAVGAHTAAQREAYLAMARSLGLDGHVVVADRTPKPAAMLNAVDVLALPSVSEGFPNVVAEAMACGTPCVVYDVGDAGRIVGDARFVVARGDADGFAAAILRVLSDRLASETLRQTVTEAYSQEANAIRSEELLHYLVTHGAARS